MINWPIVIVIAISFGDALWCCLVSSVGGGEGISFAERDLACFLEWKAKRQMSQWRGKMYPHYNTESIFLFNGIEITISVCSYGIANKVKDNERKIITNLWKC